MLLMLCSLQHVTHGSEINTSEQGNFLLLVDRHGKALSCHSVSGPPISISSTSQGSVVQAGGSGSPQQSGAPLGLWLDQSLSNISGGFLTTSSPIAQQVVGVGKPHYAE